MTKKMVIKVFMNGNSKTRSKALQIAVSTDGVQSAALGEKDKDQLEVVGVGVDAVKLVASLRKKLAKWPCLTYILPKTKVHAELLDMNDVEEKKKEETKPVDCSYPYIYHHNPNPFYIYI
ncbi:heavy metal-associated isoprenylated plant protein 47 isoform X2 [Manihot esculenta]|uniref:Uncharacterized protein n=1 Tax=Manihot esculenta TaxID=3983 RepID=A0ACB7GJK2_MANES|nr:heavy metal-associated isoprenylated plant protein 47 isoform X2 [Manihot esculenta]KAG8640432.1 hypothetical protein MANES_13G059400v8 [Manihot esculenta]